MLTLKDIVVVRDKKTILQIGDFRLEEGERLAVIGPNGAGKSTFLKVLALLETPTAGEIFFRGDKVTGQNSLTFRRRMAVVFQEPLLLNTTVFNNVAQGMHFRGIAGVDRQRRVDYWLDRFGITALRNRKPLHLSGGEAQRVSLARAFVLEPEVIFLDEPFSALDFSTRLELLEDLGTQLANTGSTTVFVTHDFNEIPYLTDNVAVIDAGAIVYKGGLKSLLAGEVAVPAVQRFLRPFKMSGQLLV
ncbi:ABC transporter ATP-binding protein [Desulfoscipio gibsoniae]|uniref:ABC-type nitrate/sulfonate/bicarbonate transport system, ATPase component n=1 Tax=Desulfoscipio gibsoniae DSM 7213 TaxID=767817 RepID=R4KIQ4_9FIRM|nr:ATP-binding cassette domain-containing protein [Desulfoscipio gibsoniae]AGL03088.1 ABC-type nitrate/sulfonate/bicarbonate transport system, ATPase component [Desulfoscipio gibsoniae DSM 7213]